MSDKPKPEPAWIAEIESLLSIQRALVEEVGILSDTITTVRRTVKTVTEQIERQGRRQKLFDLQAKDDGLWLVVNGPTKKALVNISLVGWRGPIVSAALDEVYAALRREPVLLCPCPIHSPNLLNNAETPCREPNTTKMDGDADHAGGHH